MRGAASHNVSSHFMKGFRAIIANAYFWWRTAVKLLQFILYTYLECWVNFA
jgi:hypothetical protein